MTPIRFTAKLSKINALTIVLLPNDVSKKLPSRGPTSVQGTINGTPFHSVLEPDGRGSHWLKLDKTLLNGVKAKVGDTIPLDLETSNQWPEPRVPGDLKSELDAFPKALALWKNITPNAHWDWIRWINFTKNQETRQRRIKIACSKLTAGTRRPCCFNRSMCSEPSVSQNGLLLQVA